MAWNEPFGEPAHRPGRPPAGPSTPLPTTTGISAPAPPTRLGPAPDSAPSTPGPPRPPLWRSLPRPPSGGTAGREARAGFRLARRGCQVRRPRGRRRGERRRRQRGHQLRRVRERAGGGQRLRRPAAGGHVRGDRLGEALSLNIRRCKYAKPTPIQRHAIPIAVAGRDLMACAQTGSGKTAAFCLPIVFGVLREGSKRDRHPSSRRTACPSGLVLSPTRELACQIYEEAKKFAYQTVVKVAVAYGGAPFGQQLASPPSLPCRDCVRRHHESIVEGFCERRKRK
ncbi:DEAD-box ATP-dependent RNA helicase 52C [Eucalyptus grandis]|uniref:DEAD-box ATP-dependent RNA helicase 52C n=1 Tax=Eucalyptus grandis TaxID=71139 RepID=UPI00192F0C0B|nr:DEAD-box ATP-dependent RNA helicase 52C [Eucalyptus grandis]